MKVDKFTRVDEEDCVPILSLRLEQLDRVVLLRCTEGTVFIVGSVTCVNLPAENGAFQRAARLLDFFRRQLPGDRGANLPLECRGQLGIPQEHRFKLLIGQS